MPRRPEGIPPKDLDEDSLRRELVHLYETREDTFFAGSADAYQEHTKRMLELESEYARRRPDRIKAAPSRTREGARARTAPKGRQR